jgi:hypothetical protein
VKVDELLQAVQAHIGKVVELEGYLLVILAGDQYTAYLSPSDTLNTDMKIDVEQPIAELRKIIQPLPTMILSHRGRLTHPPYLYRFPLYIKARVDTTTEQIPILHDIEAVSLYVEHPPKMAEQVEQKRYLYTAAVEYGTSRDPLSDQPAKAKITSHKVLRFVDSDDAIQVLDPDDNLYARRITQKTVTIPGWLKYLPGVDGGQAQFVLRTFAVRASVMGVGPLRGLTGIWWRPNPHYQIVRAHMPLAEAIPDTNRRVDITGRIDYLHDEVVPITSDAVPQLVFAQVDEIVLHQEDYLLNLNPE